MQLSEGIKLPSGATLKIQLSPFAVAKALYQAILAELRSVPISGATDMAALYKDLFCVGFSSPAIEAALWKCFERCTVNDVKVDGATFEPAERREDYMSVCVEVAKANVLPFARSLYAEYQRITEMIDKDQKSKSPTTT